MSESKTDFLELEIGNIMPGQEITIETTIVIPLKSYQGCFEFMLPASYFPMYPVKKTDLSEAERVLFNYKVSIKSSNSPIREISHPENFEVLDKTINSCTVNKKDSNYLEINEDIKVCFRLDCQDDTKLIY